MTNEPQVTVDRQPCPLGDVISPFVIGAIARFCFNPPMFRYVLELDDRVEQFTDFA